jgi:hypothetical protein
MLHMASINHAMAQLEAEAWEINCKRRATGKNNAETDEMTESESWPLQLQYPLANDGGSTSVTTKNTTFTPPPYISTFWELLAEFAEIEEWYVPFHGGTTWRL